MTLACEYFACLRLETSYKYRNVTFYISGADVAGPLPPLLPLFLPLFPVSYTHLTLPTICSV
eukprot:3592942-Rhodomonas_salina.1